MDAWLASFMQSIRGINSNFMKSSFEQKFVNIKSQGEGKIP